ncbi:Hypothetical Protein SLY_0534 [Strawberry lethal yellows phytoplasma (CPA) str. NZSb11]|uniref:Uncharacterized protein n=1 Tax=Strawberry lethal yellows phytoplasma (CPA) str. NZSb11 TaxID=980422 RepID=R4S136_PHYAS|nr:Hypothetical Protein SLY_0534 [Strawberry lethal yellows phytoplasma (CPA) str. NZSb11]
MLFFLTFSQYFFNYCKSQKTIQTILNIKKINKSILIDINLKK